MLRGRGPRRTDTLLLLGVLGTGCTSMLGIDGDYVNAVYGTTNPSSDDDAGVDAAVSDSGGSKGSGGKGNTGGKGGTGVGGKNGELCGDGHDAATCPTGEKCCSFTTGLTGTESACVKPAPIVGCGLDSCDVCPDPPSNAIPVCKGTACGFECVDGFVESSGQCEPQGTGGGGGSTNGSGGKASCDATTCMQSHKCNIAGPLPCCRNDDTCGCTWAPGAVCY